MTTATLPSTLPEERDEHLCALYGAAAFHALDQIHELVRQHRKYGAPLDVDGIAELCGEARNLQEGGL